MNNYIQPGNTITLTAPAGGVVSGTAYLIGQLLVVAANDADAADPFEGVTEGVFTLPKETGTAWSEGDLLYWDDADDEVTKTATGNVLIGTAVVAAASGDTTGSVRLNGVSGLAAGDLGTGVVGTTEIADDAVTADKLADHASTDASRAVTTNHIRDLAVTTAKLAADAVDGTKIADDAVDTEHLAADAVDTTAIADDAVTAAKLADDASVDANRAVTTDHVRDDAITTAKIADDAVTAAKAPVFVSTEQTGTGGSQNVAHGLAAVPALVLIAVTEDPAGTGFDVAEGAHDSTNVIVTVTSGVKFKALAWA